MSTLSKLLDSFLEQARSQSDPEIKAACCRAVGLLCPSSMLKKAAEIADTCYAVRRIDIAGGLVVYSVESDFGKKTYVVVPGKFCSCPYYKENVVQRTNAWTCKHDLAVRLKLSLGSSEGIQVNQQGIQLVLSALRNPT